MHLIVFLEYMIVLIILQLLFSIEDTLALVEI